jgi:hypothetical protein
MVYVTTAAPAARIVRDEQMRQQICVRAGNTVQYCCCSTGMF